MKQKTTILLLVVILLISACRGESSSVSDTIEVHPELKNIPVYPEAKGWIIGIPGIDTPQGYEVYSYPAEVIQSKKLVEFYKESMPLNGWEIFDEGENEIEGRKSITLFFFKPGTIAQISITQWTIASWLVTVNFYEDP